MASSNPQTAFPLRHVTMHFATGHCLSVPIDIKARELLGRWSEKRTDEDPFEWFDGLDGYRYVVSLAHLTCIQFPDGPLGFLEHYRRDHEIPTVAETARLYLFGRTEPLEIPVERDTFGPGDEEVSFGLWNFTSCAEHLSRLGEPLMLEDGDGDLVVVRAAHLVAAVLPLWACGDVKKDDNEAEAQ